MIDDSSNTAFELSQWYSERPISAGSQLTPVNGIKRKPNGKYAVWVRRLGEGSTQLVTENAESLEEAIELRRLALGNAKPSAVGICRVPLGWRVNIKWLNRNWHLGSFFTEEEAVVCRCRFDAWAAGQPVEAVAAMLERHCAPG